MIELRHATKCYGTFTAVSDLSYTVPEGCILGFLGENGAGKTTTLNMMTGYFPPTKGQILVNGVDMLRDPIKCKRQIGYLPERPPLYDEMTVEAYLAFVCNLRQVRKQKIASHIGQIMEMCALKDVSKKLIGSLSKGYRQRTGIAQALCGDPPVIILDEPTAGLDPKQVIETRELIRRLGSDHTVIFSSHILSEIQQLCQRAVILHKGRLADEIDLTRMDLGDNVFSVVLAREPDKIVPALRGIHGVVRVKCNPSGQTAVTAAEIECAPEQVGQEDIRRAIFRLCCAMDAPILELKPSENSLEKRFIRATQG